MATLCCANWQLGVVSSGITSGSFSFLLALCAPRAVRQMAGEENHLSCSWTPSSNAQRLRRWVVGGLACSGSGVSGEGGHQTVVLSPFFSFQGGKDNSKETGRTNKKQGGDRTPGDTTLLFGSEGLYDCWSFPNEMKKSACLLNNQGVMVW